MVSEVRLQRLDSCEISIIGGCCGTDRTVVRYGPGSADLVAVRCRGQIDFRTSSNRTDRVVVRYDPISIRHD